MRPVTVTELNRHIKDVLKSDPILSGIVITGEISYWKPNARTGAVFFTLKDENSQIDCVMWGDFASRLTAPYEVGMMVNLQGSVDFWNNRGQLRFNARFIEPAGAGELNAKYEKLKAALAAEGLFAPERKKTLPRFPKNIAVVTSPEGSAAWDIRQTIVEKNDYVNIFFYPVKVQGQGAAEEIALAVKNLNAYNHRLLNRSNSGFETLPCGLIDAVIVARGGGSPEERWAFNEEIVVRSIASSHIPVVTGIGHEDNESLSDLASDYYAKTPTAAADAAVPNTFELREVLSDYAEFIEKSFLRYMRRKEESLIRLDPAGLIGRLKHRVNAGESDVLRIKDRMKSDMQLIIIKDRRNSIEIIKTSLEALSPGNIMNRGYSVISGPDGKMITGTHSLKTDDDIDITMKDGKLKAKVTEIRSN